MARTAAFMCTVLMLLTVVLTAQQPVSRNVEVELTRPLLDYLRAEDEHLLLSPRNFAPPLSAAPAAGQSRLAFLAALAEVIVVVRVESKKSRPVLRDRFGQEAPADLPEANWISSTVTARVEHVLKAPAERTIDREHQLVFDEDGGTIVIGRTRVEAVNPLSRPLQPGRRYLLFGVFGEYLPSMRDGLHVAPEAAYEETAENAPLRRLSTWALSHDDDVERLNMWGAMDNLSLMLAR